LLVILFFINRTWLSILHQNEAYPPLLVGTILGDGYQGNC